MPVTEQMTLGGWRMVALAAFWPHEDAGRKVTGTGRRAGTPRIVRAAPSTRKGTRRSFLTAPQRSLRRKHLRGPTLARGSL